MTSADLAEPQLQCAVKALADKDAAAIWGVPELAARWATLGSVICLSRLRPLYCMATAVDEGVLGS